MDINSNDDGKTMRVLADVPRNLTKWKEIITYYNPSSKLIRLHPVVREPGSDWGMNIFPIFHGEPVGATNGASQPIYIIRV